MTVVVAQNDARKREREGSYETGTRGSRMIIGWVVSLLPEKGSALYNGLAFRTDCDEESVLRGLNLIRAT